MRLNLTVLMLLTLAIRVQAEPIIIPVASQGLDKSIQTPARGEKADFVRSQYGEPQSISEPTGEPPISQWQYENFSVYFEKDTVIHSVIKHKPRG